MMNVLTSSVWLGACVLGTTAIALPLAWVMVHTRLGSGGGWKSCSLFPS
ncbi:hypothetical protein VQ056_12370 [Paenibacillus sp. JTLBN-2024]